MLLQQTAHKFPRVTTESVAGELAESLGLAVRIRGPGIRRKQHCGSQAAGVSPLNCLHDKLFVARSAPTGEKEVWRNVEGDGFAIQRLVPLERVERIGGEEVVS